MADAALTSAGEARVWAAVALGWQVAKLYHSPVPLGPVTDPAQDGRLPGFSGFSAATHSKWLREQIAATTAQTELDESVAEAATRLPPPARHRRITGSSTGAMTLSEHAPPVATEVPAAT